jgi:cell division protease FtsH
MDGFDPGARVVVMAATNRAEILDAALLRPGRFDRTVEIPLPNYVERTAILAIHGNGKTLAPDVDLGLVARGTRSWPRSRSMPTPSPRSRSCPVVPLLA